MIIYSYSDFLNIIDKNTKGVFLIYGQEKYFIRKSVISIYKKISCLPEINTTILSGENININSIINSCETLPVISDKKLVHIKNPDFLKKTKKENSVDKNNLNYISENFEVSLEESNLKEIYNTNDVPAFLSKYILTLPEHLILLVTYEDDIDLNNKVVTSVKNSGYLICYSKPKTKELEDMAHDMFKYHGKEIKKSDIAYVVSNVSSMDELEIEIEKICSFALNDKVITRYHIEAVTCKNIENNIFKIIDVIIKKNTDQAVSILNMLLFQGENHLIILAMIIRQYRMILNVKRYLSLGKKQGDIKNDFKIKNEITLKNLIYQANCTNFGNLKKSLLLCLETDYKIKSGRVSPELALEMLIVDLCK